MILTIHLGITKILDGTYSIEITKDFTQNVMSTTHHLIRAIKEKEALGNRSFSP